MEVPFFCYDKFFKDGVGNYAWDCLENIWCLLLLTPHKKRKNGELICIYPWHAENNWSQPGKKLGWNFNLRKPSFWPSIDGTCGGKHPDSWHGFFINGKFNSGQKELFVPNKDW